MKKLLIILSVLTILFTACKKDSFLDNKSNNALNEQSVFTDSLRTMQFLTRIYDDEAYTFTKARWENGSTEQATDDSEYNLQNGARRPNILIQSSYNADNPIGFDEIWTLPYNNIRRVNLLISELPKTPMKAATKTRITAEARFLRAWYYFNLLINFGGITNLKDQVFALTDEVNVPRSTFEESVNYIAKELDDAAAILPASYQGNEYGRVTKGAALAIKAKLLLFAASPLFNGNQWPSPTTAAKTAIAGYPTYSVARWQAAADAAKAVMNLNTYQLVVDNGTAPGYGFYSMFLQRINPEYIFFFNRPPNKDFEAFYMPGSRGGGKYGTPTQNAVDAFTMKSGKPITDASTGYNAQNPYVNRDPRFYYSIIYNGALYFNQTTGTKDPVFTYVGASPDGFVYSASVNGPSGYFFRKMCDENLAANSPGNTNRGWPLMRYAEILLSYAEAINETGQTALAYQPLKDIRARAGIDPGSDSNYGLNPNMSVAEMRAVIQNERRVELMLENNRWDDVRRWKLAVTNFNGYNKVMQITKNSNGSFTYQIIPSLWFHTFGERNYILPIPTSEIRKSPALIQNPGW